MTTLNPYSAPNPQPEDDPPLVAQLAIEGEGMTVEFEQTFEDLVVFSDYHWRQQPAFRKHLFGVIGVGIFLISLVATPAHEEFLRSGWFGALLGWTFGLLFIVIYGYQIFARRYLIRRNLHRAYSEGKNLSVFGPRRITITPEFLMYAAPLSQSAHRWAGVEKIGGDKDGIYIFISSLSAYVLPRRAFNSDQHYQEFARAAEKYFHQ
jgi:hypothetical protein